MKRLIITAAALLICGCSDSDDTSSSAGISAAADSPAAVTTTTVTTVPPEQPMNSELPDESETVTTASQTVTSAPTQTTASASSAKQDKPLTADDLGFKNVDSIGSKYEFTYGGEVFTAIYTPDNWKIIDSYKIEKESDILLVCKILVAEHPVHGKDMISYRTPDDMSIEWQQHNLAYKLLPSDHKWKNNAKDVDLDPKDQGKSLSEMFLSRME